MLPDFGHRHCLITEDNLNMITPWGPWGTCGEEFERAPSISPRGALGRAGTLGPHLDPGRPGAVTVSRLLQSGGKLLCVFSGGAGGRENSGGGLVDHAG